MTVREHSAFSKPEAELQAEDSRGARKELIESPGLCIIEKGFGSRELRIKASGPWACHPVEG
jgi:hypothetical protein